MSAFCECVILSGCSFVLGYFLPFQEAYAMSAFCEYVILSGYSFVLGYSYSFQEAIRERIL